MFGYRRRQLVRYNDEIYTKDRREDECVDGLETEAAAKKYPSSESEVNKGKGKA